MSNPIKSAEMAPVLQSMQDYICNHFTDELMDEVSSAVSLGLVEDLDIDAEGGKPVVQRNESKIIRTEFWRLDCTKLLADIKMRRSAYQRQHAGAQHEAGSHSGSVRGGRSRRRSGGRRLHGRNAVWMGNRFRL